MTPQQITLVRSSFKLFSTLQPVTSAAGAIFYAKLFANDPSLRHMFKGDMAQQGERLMAMIGNGVAMLDRADALLPVLRQLGARHVRYGVRDEHYDIVGAVLLETLEQALAEDFSAEVRKAWIAAYGLISATMKEGAMNAWEEALA
ncbi:globin family protein [Paucibacter sp. R3-3]|uniref:Globin family protein n=1 Tax=Roseateles agri TaxID=3098619 RepID=A0ABU5DIJ8_9BURK|nr:globin family protein [Paucibacter sp. R3-3]MDY0745606.1 globin family protein [Paucibacter sp. R3-3]